MRRGIFASPLGRAPAVRGAMMFTRFGFTAGKACEDHRKSGGADVPIIWSFKTSCPR